MDGAIQKHKKLRHELLRLESSQRELEFKMIGCTARLNRMKIISFASQKLDKSISRCERTIQNLANRLVQITSLKQEVRTKLTASVDHLQEVQSQLTSSVSKQSIEANVCDNYEFFPYTIFFIHKQEYKGFAFPKVMSKLP